MFSASKQICFHQVQLADCTSQMQIAMILETFHVVNLVLHLIQLLFILFRFTALGDITQATVMVHVLIGKKN